MQPPFQTTHLNRRPAMHVICAIDGSEYAAWGVQVLEALAARPPEKVTLLHVVGPSTVHRRTARRVAPAKWLIAAMERAGRELLRRTTGLARISLGQAVTKPHTDVDVLLSHGAIAPTIVKEARRRRADLLILGSRGLSDVQGFLLGSVSRTVAAQAHCPVLVVKRPIHTLDHVLLAADNSKHSRAAAAFLRTRFLPETSHVTILSVVEPLVTELAVKYVAAAHLNALMQTKREHADRLVGEMRALFLKDGYAVTTEVDTDHVSDTIVQAAARINADLLVVGSRGLTGTERFQLGSVSETLVKYAGCAVLIVRGWRE